ncbi:RRP12-like protein [Oopsacas minuta]|uniref:RRP12-like protein n=1 Tax=Oopsacas minuta TaxID=111878 RepID=A0AAV7JTC1_9METZ|nr:RRP12-like protein [Oopsacas minuta]
MPSKIRVRHGRSVKRKKWPKGHSSDSNPATHKYRREARTGLSLPDNSINSVKSSIADFQMLHEQDENDDDIVNEIENLSLSGVTNLSTFSHCTNTSFTTLGNLWSSRLESHQDICAVLAAVTDVIKSNGGTESDTDYFAALCSAFESADDVTTATSVAFLLSVIVVKVPEAVLQAQYSHLTKLISSKLDKFEGNDSGTSLQRSLVSCLSTLLSKQPLTTWQESFTQNMFYRILQQTISSKPKVRRVAHQGLCIITQSALVSNQEEDIGEPLLAHPIWKMSTQFFQEVFQKHARKDQIKSVFHVLNLLKFILHIFPLQDVKVLCECILKCTTSKSHHLHILSLKILQTFLIQTPHISCLSSELNCQIMQALIQTHPKPHELDFIEPWLGTVQAGITHLSNINASKAQSICPNLFGICFEYLRLCHSALIFNRIVTTLDIVIHKCLIENAGSLKLDITDKSPFLSKVLEAIQTVLIARNPDSITHILKIQAALFRIFDRDTSDMLRHNVIFLANTVKNWPEITTHCAHLEFALSVAVEVMGVEKFIECVPIMLSEDEVDLSNSWLLPFLKNCIKNEEISFFKEFFIPMATRLRQRATQLAQIGEEVNAKICETLESQIWDLLPSFLKTAINVEEEFPSIARLLGTLLQERVDLRNNIATALRQLIEHHINNEQAIDCVKKYSKNYLPILFNLYVDTESKNHNKAIILGCLASFVKISSNDIIEGYFNKIGTMLNSDDTEDMTKTALLDIGSTMLPYIKISQLALTLKQTGHYLTTDRHSLQKKGYLALERMLNLSKEDQLKFVKSNIKSFKWLIVNSASNMNPTSTKYRLKCIFSVLQIIECDDSKFITSILPEVILSMKETNIEVRNISYNILLLIGKFALDSGEDKHEMLEAFIAKITAGLAGSEHMQSCTILCLGKLVHEFRFSLPNDMVEKLLQAVYTFSESTSKQIVKYCLYFVNVIVSVMGIGFVMENIKILVARMLKWNKNVNNKFLLKVKVIIEKMLRKVDFEHVSEAFPISQKDLLRNVRKSASRRKRQRDSNRERRVEESIRDSDSITVVSRGLVPAGYDEIMLSDEEMDEDRQSRKTKSEKGKGKQIKKSKMWIQEDETGDPIDLLDPKSSDRILTINPKKRKKKEKASISEETFSFNEEGKLIVTNERGEKIDMDSASETESIQTEIKSTTTAGASSVYSKRSSVKKSKFHKPLSDGREYISKKAGGDMKRKNKPPPYAYFPLNKGQLRIKRKQKKLQGTLKAILRKASKGSVNGRKVRHTRNNKLA